MVIKGALDLTPDLNPIAEGARRRIALRLLPFVFLLYVICYVDRANVAFANLRMSADLGFSDRVYGFGVGMFFVGYVLFEVPGVIVLERWSARTYWVPTFIKRLSGLPSSQVALLAALPGLVGILTMLGNGWHSDKTGERRWHTSIPLLIGGAAYLLLLSATHNLLLTIFLLVVGGGAMFAYYPVFWSMPTLVLTETAAAAGFGFINSIGQCGGFVGPYAVGYLNQRTGTLLAAFAFYRVFLPACRHRRFHCPHPVREIARGREPGR